MIYPWGRAVKILLALSAESKLLLVGLWTRIDKEAFSKLNT